METLAMLMMLRTVPFRHEHLDTLADQLVARVTEQRFRLCVDLNNDALMVYGGDGIRNCFQD
jgi:hypothetical protein